MLFGFNLPSYRWLDGFADLPIRDDMRPKTLLENAKRALGRRLHPVP